MVLWEPIRLPLIKHCMKLALNPDWATSTSIGATNASIIAGNKPTKRVSGLTAFWQSVDHGPFQQVIGTRRCGGVGIEVAHFDGAAWRCTRALPTALAKARKVL